MVRPTEKLRQLPKLDLLHEEDLSAGASGIRGAALLSGGWKAHRWVLGDRPFGGPTVGDFL